MYDFDDFTPKNPFFRSYIVKHYKILSLEDLIKLKFILGPQKPDTFKLTISLIDNEIKRRIKTK